MKYKKLSQIKANFEKQLKAWQKYQKAFWENPTKRNKLLMPEVIDYVQIDKDIVSVLQEEYGFTEKQAQYIFKTAKEECGQDMPSLFLKVYDLVGFLDNFPSKSE